MQILQIIGLILLVIFIFNLMIIVHELGHYWAAQWRGLKIDRFQIWFGKPIIKFTHKGVQWGLGTIPFGGFVALPQMSPMEAIEGSNTEQRELPKITPLDKIIVAFAGPLFSFLLAALFALVVSFTGYPQDTGGDTTVGYVQPDSPAAKAGIQPLDKIISIDGVAVQHFSGMSDSIVNEVVHSTTRQLPVTLERNGQTQTLTVPLAEKEHRFFNRSEPRSIGIAPIMPATVQSVMEHSPAELAGIKAGDTITHINDQPIHFLGAVGSYFQDGEPAQLSLTRADGSSYQVSLAAAQPDQPADYPAKIIGVTWDPGSGRQLTRPGVLDQISYSAGTIFRTLKALTSSQSAVGVNDLAGPIGIGEMYYNLLILEDGWRFVLWFSVVLNINLAILNMLPLPVLDGGHIVLAIFEKIFRRPLSRRILEPLYTGCALLLFAFMGYKLIQESGLLLFGGDQEQEQNAVTTQPSFDPPQESANSSDSPQTSATPQAATQTEAPPAEINQTNTSPTSPQTN